MSVLPDRSSKCHERRDAQERPPFAAASSTTIPRPDGKSDGSDSDANREHAARSVELNDNSHFYRFGLKGPRAAEWLQQHGVTVPAMPNTWAALTSEVPALIARLGQTEFFIEYVQKDALVAQLIDDLEAPLDGVYPVLREDRALVLRGDEVHDVLAQVCNIDFRSVSRAGRPVIMTMLAGIAVLVIPHNSGYRIWCDPSFGDSLQSTLHDVIKKRGMSPFSD